MKRYLLTVLALVAVVFVVVAGCPESGPPPAAGTDADTAANPDMMIDMPADPEDSEAPAPEESPPAEPDASE